VFCSTDDSNQTSGSKMNLFPVSTVCIKNLDQGRDMIIFESVLTIFIASVALRGAWDSSKKWLELKIEPP
jgi:hypothetical protein